MIVEEFLELFIKELEGNTNLREYYRLINNKGRFLWRKAYLEQRLNYVHRHLAPPPGTIWDAGCGYATTAIFLALNGYKVEGNTLEFYYDKIQSRLDYWSRFGNLDKLTVEYANLFDMPIKTRYYDAIIAQDTLHHLEPIRDALQIFSKSLKPEGRLVITEENGMSLFIRLKNFSRRGFKRISEYHDEKLQKTILFGNENARSMQVWQDLFHENEFQIPDADIEYIRLFPHFFYTRENYLIIKDKEMKTVKNLPWLKEFLFFGINFTAIQNMR